jgi:hypothetical protein
MCDYYRVYKTEVSRYVRKDGMRLVKHFGCNGKDHRITYYHLCCDAKGENANNGECNVRPDKPIGECDYYSCKNLGAFSADTETTDN